MPQKPGVFQLHVADAPHGVLDNLLLIHSDILLRRLTASIGPLHDVFQLICLVLKLGQSRRDHILAFNKDEKERHGLFVIKGVLSLFDLQKSFFPVALVDLSQQGLHELLVPTQLCIYQGLVPHFIQFDGLLWELWKEGAVFMGGLQCIFLLLAHLV